MRPQRLVAAGLLVVAANAGCSLGLDESLIPQETPPADAIAVDASSQDGPSAEGDVSVETAKDVSTDPAAEGETGAQDVKVETKDATGDGDAGCSAGPDSGACVVCAYSKCCSAIGACKGLTTCATALAWYETCENAGGQGASCTQLTDLGGTQGGALQACIQQLCQECF